MAGDNLALLSQDGDSIPVDLPVGERLRIVGNRILRHSLQPLVVALMRVVITTAYRFPTWPLTNSIGRDRGIELAAQAIAGDQAATPDALERALPTATKFIEMVLVPFQMRATMGDDLIELSASVPGAIDEAVALLSAGGWRTGDPVAGFRYRLSIAVTA